MPNFSARRLPAMIALICGLALSEDLGIQMERMLEAGGGGAWRLFLVMGNRASVDEQPPHGAGWAFRLPAGYALEIFFDRETTGLERFFRR
ncbi:MAG: hypothetical protein JSU00_26160 [Acidobacteria bacterium]|nr:hypothetical protein [Acidobacteriota bacterium]